MDPSSSGFAPNTQSLSSNTGVYPITGIEGSLSTGSNDFTGSSFTASDTTSDEFKVLSPGFRSHLHNIHLTHTLHHLSKGIVEHNVHKRSTLRSKRSVSRTDTMRSDTDNSYMRSISSTHKRRSMRRSSLPQLVHNLLQRSKRNIPRQQVTYYFNQLASSMVWYYIIGTHL